ncbi:MAG: GspE/PulE family protein [Thermoanaerobaculia bacterium]
MDRLAKLLRWLALAAGLAGVYCFLRVYRPADFGAVFDAVRHFAPLAAAHPAVPVAAVLVVVTALASRLIDRPSPVDLAAGSRQRHVHRLEVGEPPDGPRPKIRTPETRRHRRDARRRRLEAYLGENEDVVGFVDDLLACAVRTGASDVHLQPLELRTRTSLRVGGELEEVAATPRSLHDAVVRRLKVLARLVPYQTDRPQDGHIALDTPLGTVDVRLSTLPTNHGEKVVMRLQRAADARFDLDRLGMSESVRTVLEELLAEPQGILVLTGPTGSGKTTTLYGALAHIHQNRGETVNIATIEDPVEVDLPFLNQTERAPGLAFHDALRAVLRQDPNVLMIGEIRDRETCQTAVQAGLSGHLILTTLHADSAAGVSHRLVDLGSEPFLVASSILAAVSQRLVRRLCPECRRPAPVARRLVKRLAGKGIDVTGRTFFDAPGCDACDRTGFRGRRAIFELLRMSPGLRQLVTIKATAEKIRQAAVDEGMTPLLSTAVAEAEAGTISLEEALRVVS